MINIRWKVVQNIKKNDPCFKNIPDREKKKAFSSFILGVVLATLIEITFY